MLSYSRSHFYLLVAAIGCLLPSAGKAQKIDTISTFSITGYIDAYYAYYTDSVGPGNYQKFPTAAPRSNTPGLNIAQVSMQYTGEKIRAMGTFHFGDIPRSTWDGQLNNIQEAHIGVKVCSKLWVDAGLFRTHYGTEFLTPAENITSSVAVGTYFEPYYESGIRLNFDPTPKLEINLFLLDGYNLYVDYNNKKSFGMGITYAVNEHLGIGYTNYTGDDSPPATVPRHLRISHNAFINYQAGKIKLQAGGDFMTQQNSDLAAGNKTAGMYSALLTARYQCTEKLAVYARGEVLQDNDGFVTGTIQDNTGKYTGLKLWGLTAGLEYKPTPESYIKLEGRRLQMDDDQQIFYTNGSAQSSRIEVMINAGVTFELLHRVATRIVQ